MSCSDTRCHRQPAAEMGRLGHKWSQERQRESDWMPGQSPLHGDRTGVLGPRKGLGNALYLKKDREIGGFQDAPRPRFPRHDGVSGDFCDLCDPPKKAPMIHNDTGGRRAGLLPTPPTVASGNGFAAPFPAPALGSRRPNRCQAAGNALFAALSELAKWRRPAGISGVSGPP